MIIIIIYYHYHNDNNNLPTQFKHNDNYYHLLSLSFKASIQSSIIIQSKYLNVNTVKNIASNVAASQNVHTD